MLDMKNAAKIFVKMDGLKMNEKLYLEIVEEAETIFKKYESQNGLTITCK